jgi:hypothetical protein
MSPRLFVDDCADRALPDAKTLGYGPLSNAPRKPSNFQNIGCRQLRAITRLAKKHRPMLPFVGAVFGRRGPPKMPWVHANLVAAPMRSLKRWVRGVVVL